MKAVTLPSPTKADVNYEPNPPRCGNCRNHVQVFRAMAFTLSTRELGHQCTLIRSRVSRFAICDRWLDEKTGAPLVP